ncbi:hypothetical protein [Streptomyces sp. WAC06614]|uniref:hypothetical protein n=1 Tax=Streptomyces sp. WAC06614 TaxID=2487416 RepID=UPI0021AFE276|nr:hypothetical protein [Streptomyces sp. WAC06614]
MTALLGAGATGAILVLGAFGASTGSSAPAAPGPARQTSAGFTVYPETVEPGGTVTLAATGCTAAETSISSGVFDSVRLEQGRTAKVRVDRDARRGALYTVTFTCGGVNHSVDIAIAGGVSPPTTSSTASALPLRTVTPYPVRTGRTRAQGCGRDGPARGGIGGSVSTVNTLQLGAGAALLLVSAVGTVVVLRRRSGAGGRH